MSASGNAPSSQARVDAEPVVNKENSSSRLESKLSSRLRASTKFFVGFIVGATALAVTALQLRDRLVPPVTVYGGEVLSADVVALGTTYQAYVHFHPNLFPDRNATIANAGNDANVPGAVVNVVLRLQGLRGRSCMVTATVYRVPLIRVAPPRRALDRCGARVQDGDQGGWPAWVRLPGHPGRYFIRFDVYDDATLLLGPGKSTAVFAWDPRT